MHTPTSTHAMHDLLAAIAHRMGPQWRTSPDHAWRPYGHDGSWAEVSVEPTAWDTIRVTWTITIWDACDHRWRVSADGTETVPRVDDVDDQAQAIVAALSDAPLTPPTIPDLRRDAASLPLHYDHCGHCGAVVLIPPTAPAEVPIDPRTDTPVEITRWVDVHALEPITVDLRGAVRAWGHGCVTWPIAFDGLRGWQPTDDISTAALYLVEHKCGGWPAAARLGNLAHGIRVTEDLTVLDPESINVDPWDDRPAARLERAA